MSAIDQVNKIKAALQDNPNVRIIAATKYFDVAKTKEIIEAGITEIGENRKDTFLEKYERSKIIPLLGTISGSSRFHQNFHQVLLNVLIFYIH